ncbi:MAG: 2-oxoacid:acceptor oxidoreductase family protein, partial [Thermoplasmatales archaeon]
TELHGMAQRGGKISVEVRIGDYNSAIIPAHTADAIVAFEELEAVRSLNKLKEGGMILLSRRKIHPVSMTINRQNYPVELIDDELKKHNTINVEADLVALNLGNKRVANTVMVGAVHSTGILGLAEESLITAIKESLPEKFWEVNMKAFEEGKNLLSAESAKAV